MQYSFLRGKNLRGLVVSEWLPDWFAGLFRSEAFSVIIRILLLSAVQFL
ncbi:MAG: hypothetical protein GQF41_3737 [Candidatus Rifleibacterium amylolyticum]|nr:MAG: hypothetical protein GQF41_3737 [Candidatus Rifleibacterium amylolyticum]